MYIKNILNQDDILSTIGYLEQQIEKIDNYPDKWLFFQDPTIYGAWQFLINALQDKSFSNDPEEIIEWKQDTEKYVLYLLTLRELCIKFKELCGNYLDTLHNLLVEYGEWLEGDNISASEIEEMVDIYGENLKDFGNIRNGLLQMNSNSHNARFAVHSALCDNQDFLLALMNMGGEIVKVRKPSLNLFTEAINNALILYTKQFGSDILVEMKEELNRNYKNSLIELTNPQHWADMLKANDEGLKMAINKELAQCQANKQEHWDRHQTKEFLDENSELISRIYELCKTEELIDLKNFDNVQSFLNLLNEENIELFYDIIVSRSLIQCEIFPDLKAQHNAWLNKVQEKPDDIDEEHEIISDDNELPTELKTEEAEELWKQLRDAGFIIANGYDLAEGVSNNQAAYIAFRFREKLGYNFKWKPFIQLWRIKNMAQFAGNWQKTGIYPPRAKDIDDIFGVKLDKPKGYVKLR